MTKVVTCFNAISSTHTVSILLLKADCSHGDAGWPRG